MNSRLIWPPNFVNVIFYFMVVLILASCTSSGRHPASIKIDSPLSHVWQYLQFYGEEELGYATYSYVLVGRDGSNEKSTSLYYELVNTIKASTVNAENLRDIVSNSSLNLFLIPISDTSSTERKEPNYELSKTLLSLLSTTSPLKFSRPGPYIITLYQPISLDNGDKIADILYIDLTGAHLKAIPEIVRTYREKVIDEELSGIEKLKSLRLSLLNIALHAEDSIGFAKSAYAGMRSAFSE